MPEWGHSAAHRCSYGPQETDQDPSQCRNVSSHQEQSEHSILHHSILSLQQFLPS